MKVNVVDFTPKEQDYVELMKKYELLRQTKLQAEKEMKDLRKDLDSYVDTNGEDSDKGKCFKFDNNHYYLRTVSMRATPNIDKAYEIARSYGVLDRMIVYPPTLDEQVLASLVEDGVIPIEVARECFDWKEVKSTRIVGLGDEGIS